MISLFVTSLEPGGNTIIMKTLLCPVTRPTRGSCLTACLLFILTENLNRGRKRPGCSAGLWGVCSLSAGLWEGPEAGGAKRRQDQCWYVGFGFISVASSFSLCPVGHFRYEMLFVSPHCFCPFSGQVDAREFMQSLHDLGVHVSLQHAEKALKRWFHSAVSSAGSLDCIK